MATKNQKGQATVSRRRKKYGREVDSDAPNKSESVTSPDAPVTTAPNALARVSYRHGVSINLGDFNNEQVAVSLEMPCRPKQDSIDLVADFVVDWVDTRLDKEVDKIDTDSD